MKNQKSPRERASPESQTWDFRTGIPHSPTWGRAKAVISGTNFPQYYSVLYVAQANCRAIGKAPGTEVSGMAKNGSNNDHVGEGTLP